MIEILSRGIIPLDINAETEISQIAKDSDGPPCECACYEESYGGAVDPVVGSPQP